MQKFSLSDYEVPETFVVDFVDFSGKNWMHIAVENENIGVLRQLISKHKHLIDQMDNDGHTPLSLAIKEERYLCSKFLLQANANCVFGGYLLNLIRQILFRIPFEHFHYENAAFPGERLDFEGGLCEHVGPEGQRAFPLPVFDL